MDIENTRFRTIPYLISQFGWMTIIFAFLLIGVFTKDQVEVGTINSYHGNYENSLKTNNKNQLTQENWQTSINFNDDPILLMQLSDLHLNNKYNNNKTANQFFKALNQSATYYFPSTIIISGDLVDNLDDLKDDIGYGVPHLGDYLLYQSVLKSVHNLTDSIIDIAGNHDEYGVGDLHSPYHYISNYSLYYSRYHTTDNISSFWISRHETDKIEIFSISPFWHPIPHTHLAFNIYPTSDFLDTLEHTLNEHSVSSKPRLVQCHFPLNLWFGKNRIKSTHSKKTVIEILRSANVSLFMSGHWHPRSIIAYHHRDLLEIVCPDLKDHLKFGLIAIDNGRLSYHETLLTQQSKFIVTHPVPIQQFSSQTTFHESLTPIRILAFEQLESITARIDENEYKLNFTKMTNNHHFLYSLNNVSLSNGKHHLKVTSTANGQAVVEEFDFFIGESIDMDPELDFTHPSYKIVLYCCLGLTWFTLFIITFPIVKISDSVCQIFKISEFNEWIFGNDSHHDKICCYTILNLLKSFFLGPLAMNQRINKCSIPLSLRLFTFAIVVYAACLPNSFIVTEKYVGIIWAYGYIFKGRNIFDQWGPKYVACYVSVFLVPAVVLLDSISSVFATYLLCRNANLPSKCKSVKCLCTFLFDLIFFLVGFGGIFACDYYLLITAVDWLCALLSPMYVIIPIITFIWFLVIIIKLIKSRGITDENSGNIFEPQGMKYQPIYTQSYID